MLRDKIAATSPCPAENVANRIVRQASRQERRAQAYINSDDSDARYIGKQMLAEVDLGLKADAEECAEWLGAVGCDHCLSGPRSILQRLTGRGEAVMCEGMSRLDGLSPVLRGALIDQGVIEHTILDSANGTV